MADPVTASLVIGGIGAGISAMGTIAGGSAAATAGNNALVMGESQQNQDNYQAAQLTENASSEIGAAQRTMLDTQQKTRMAESTITADAAGSGFTASAGTPAAISGSVAQRGTYEAAMNLWQGENASTGDLNKAQGDVLSGDIALQGGQMQQQAGQMQQQASYYTAAGNLATSGSTLFSNYGKMSGGTAGTMMVGGNAYPAFG
jgi:hypothetical protein